MYSSSGSSGPRSPLVATVQVKGQGFNVTSAHTGHYYRSVPAVSTFTQCSQHLPACLLFPLPLFLWPNSVWAL